MSSPRQPEQKNDSDDHVYGMHSCHREVQEEEDLRLLRHVRSQRLFLDSVTSWVSKHRDIEAVPRNVVQLILLVILVVLDPKEDQAEKGGKHQHEHQKAFSRS